MSHSDDGAGAADSRVSYVPAARWDEDATRAIWPDLEDYPRFVGTARGKTYHPMPGQKETEPIGAIPQVRLYLPRLRLTCASTCPPGACAGEAHPWLLRVELCASERLRPKLW